MAAAASAVSAGTQLRKLVGQFRKPVWPVASDLATATTMCSF